MTQRHRRHPVGLRVRQTQSANATLNFPLFTQTAVTVLSPSTTASATVSPTTASRSQISLPGIASIISLLDPSASSTAPIASTGLSTVLSTPTISTTHITTTSSTSSSTSSTVTSDTPKPAVITQTHQVVKTVFTTSSPTPSPSSSATAAAAVRSTGVNTGVVVGAIGGAIIAVIALILLISFFLRRARNKRKNNMSFNPQDFHRSPEGFDSHEDMTINPFNPRPPSMIERRLVSPAPTFGPQYNVPDPYYHSNFGGYSEDHAEYLENRAGHSENHTPYLENHTAYSENHAGYSEDRAGHSENHTGYSGNRAGHSGNRAYPENHAGIGTHLQPHAPGQGDYGAPPSRVRQVYVQNPDPFSPSNASIPPPYQEHHNEQQSLGRRPEKSSPDSRSRPVPPSLPLPSVPPQHTERYPLPIPSQSGEVPPFVIPKPALFIPGAQIPSDHRNPNASPRPVSGESVLSVSPNILDFPAPPSSAYTESTRYASPKLPKTSVGSRASIANHGSFLNAGHKLPGRLSSIDHELSFLTPAATYTPTSVLTAAPAALVEKRSTTHSAYNPEDAYGGI